MMVIACVVAAATPLTWLFAAPSQDSPQTAAATQPAEPPPASVSALEQIRRDAQALAPLVQSEVAKRFLEATAELPPIEPRTLYREETTRSYHSQLDYERMPPEQREKLKAIPVDESLYYNTKYGSPLAYSRPLDLLGQGGMASVNEKSILDFGYGTVGHLRLLASLGAEVTGVDVDSFLAALYSDPRDQGLIGTKEGGDGRITLVNGRFPAEAPALNAVREAGAGGYDLIISKNTLKRGYIHPEREVDKRMLVDLGVDDETFVRTLHSILKPGGRVMIYNLCPAPAPLDQPYIPWADGRCPFDRAMIEKAGFKILAFDADDSAAARAMGLALGWDDGKGATELEANLFAHYTLLEKPAGP